MNIDNIKLPTNLNKRIALTLEQKKTIREKYKNGEGSMRSLAVDYGVSKRTIQFTVYPERYEAALSRRRSAWADGKYREYYDKEKHREAVADIRRRKKSSINQ